MKCFVDYFQINNVLLQSFIFAMKFYCIKFQIGSIFIRKIKFYEILLRKKAYENHHCNY